MEFKNSNILILKEIFSIETNIDGKEYGFENSDIFYYSISGEILYCDLLIDAKIIINEYQLCDFTDILQLEILQIIGSEIIVDPKTATNYKRFNDLSIKIKHISTENIDQEEETEIFIIEE